MSAPERARWRVGNDAAGLTRLQAEVDAWLTRAGVAKDCGQRLLLALDELAANVLQHSGLPPGSSFEVGLERDGDELLLSLVDAGAPFDPTLHADRASPDELHVGGFGLSLVRGLARSLRHSRVDGCNRLELRFDAFKPYGESPAG